MINNDRKAALEAIIYAADEPATIDQLATALGEDKIAVQNSLDELVASYASDERGIEIRAVAGGYKMYTSPSTTTSFVASSSLFALRFASPCLLSKLSPSSLTSSP